jgi:hypothetical protein
VGADRRTEVRGPQDLTPGSAHVTKLFSFIGATVLGYAGWYLGLLVGTMTAFVLMMVGTGVGMYYGVKIGRHYSG